MKKTSFPHFIIPFLFISLVFFYPAVSPLLVAYGHGHGIAGLGNAKLHYISRNLTCKMGVAEADETWDISTNVTIINRILSISNDILIHDNGTLTLINSTLEINSTFPGELGVKVVDGGSLILMNSTITAFNASNPYYVKVTNGSTLCINNSKISHAGTWGSPILQSESQHSGGLYYGSELSVSEMARDAVYTEKSHIVILNSVLQDIKCGILLYYLKNCMITDNIISGDSELWLAGSNSSVVANNTLISMSIWLAGTKNVNVSDNTLIGGEISISNPINTCVIRNTIIDGHKVTGIVKYMRGIFVYMTAPGVCEVKDNRLFRCGFFIDGGREALTGLILENNMINLKPLIFILNSSNQEYAFRNYVGQVITIYSENITIQDTYISDAGSALVILQSTNVTLTNVTLIDNSVGIFLTGCTNCLVVRSNVISAVEGIYAHNCANCLVVRSNVISAVEGIHAYKCRYITITENIIESNSYGIYLDNSNNNTISENIIQGNHYGIYLCGSQNNTITNNTFRDNTVDVFDWASSRPWYQNLFIYLGVFLVGVVVLSGIIIVVYLKYKYKKKRSQSEK